MKYLAAYLLLTTAGKTPSAADVKKVLSSVGIEAEEAQVTEVIKALDGKSIDELITEGTSKLASVPSGGAAPAAAGGASSGASGSAPAAEEKKEEEKEESDDDMGFGLFD